MKKKSLVGSTAEKLLCLHSTSCWHLEAFPRAEGEGGDIEKETKSAQVLALYLPYILRQCSVSLEGHILKHFAMCLERWRELRCAESLGPRGGWLISLARNRMGVCPVPLPPCEMHN